jgi:hypothetical protein
MNWEALITAIILRMLESHGPGIADAIGNLIIGIFKALTPEEQVSLATNLVKELKTKTT